jgi:hypothetical protein
MIMIKTESSVINPDVMQRTGVLVSPTTQNAVLTGTTAGGPQMNLRNALTVTFQLWIMTKTSSSVTLPVVKQKIRGAVILMTRSAALMGATVGGPQMSHRNVLMTISQL